MVMTKLLTPIHNQYAVKLKLSGEYSHYKRPESGADGYPYEVPTPGGVRGVVDACAYKRGMMWAVLGIYVIKKGRLVFETTNCLKFKVSKTTLEKGEHHQTSGDARTQISMGMMKNVEFIVEVAPATNDQRLAHEMSVRLIRNVRRGRLRDMPYLGHADMDCQVEIPTGDECPVEETRPLGTSLYDIARSGAARPVFYKPWMVNGVVDTHPRRVLPDDIYGELFCL